jgi:hypothetical protein
VAEALAEALALPLVDLGRTLVVPDAVRLLPRGGRAQRVLVLEHRCPEHPAPGPGRRAGRRGA